MESIHDEDYGGDNDDYNFIDEDVEDDIETDDDNKGDKKPYTILSEEDILKKQDEIINKVSSVLSVSKSWASLMLPKFQWNVERVASEWFTDEEKVRKLVGLVENSSSAVVAKDVQCLICLESCCYEKTHAAMCGHRFCDQCWEQYLVTAIKDGPACLSLRCPDPSCCAAIDQELIEILVCDEYKKKYFQYLFRSYVENKVKTKWCPAPGCEFAIEFYGGNENENFDVSCKCSHQFCYNCDEEGHRPVDCGTVSKWLIKNTSDSENTNWIFVNSKPCPKCKRNIEKNQGCNHMTCNSQCGYQFCWICLGNWKYHTSSSCNAYKAEKKNKKTTDEVEMKRQRVKQSLKKYTHYYERWLGNHNSMVKAASNLNDVQKTHLPFIRDKMRTSDMQLEFITEAWLQIIECRRVLKWTYAYGYYLPVQNQDKKEFFEYLQGEAESALEKLHECAEKDMLVFLKDNKEETKTDETEIEFKDFGIKLETLTKVNKTYFDNLVRALENGLLDVNHRENCRKQTSRVESGKEDIYVSPPDYELPDGYTPYTYGLPDGYIYSFSDEDDY